MDYKIDYYHVLRVKKTASKEELKASYRQLAKLHHPDKNPGDPLPQKDFRLVQDAYETLSNEITRHLYDEYRVMNDAATGQTTDTKTDSFKRGSAKPSPAKSKTFTETKKVWREKRVYVMGRISVKFQGIPEATNSYMAAREQDYIIYPTETLVKIQSSGVYKDGPPRDYEKAYSSAELFAVPLGAATAMPDDSRRC